MGWVIAWNLLVIVFCCVRVGWVENFLMNQWVGLCYKFHGLSWVWFEKTHVHVMPGLSEYQASEIRYFTLISELQS